MPELPALDETTAQGLASGLICESMNFLQTLQQDLIGPDKFGTLWQQTGGGTGPYPPVANYLNIILQSSYFNKVQRWLARYLYHVNAYAISIVQNKRDLVIGPGYEINCESDASQRRVDEWLEQNNWALRMPEAYERLIVDGEVFFRVFKGGIVRFVEPDLVYGTEPGVLSGIKTKPDDYETIESYMVNQGNGWNQQYGESQAVPADQMQHRKFGAWSSEPRGFSLLLAVYGDILEASKLLTNLGITLDAQARVAIVRKHQADKQAVQALNAGRANEVPVAGYATPYTNCSPRVDGVEAIPPASIVDTGDTSTFELTSGGLMADKYIEVLRAILRKVAARCGLPEALVSQDQANMAAYTAALVPNSHLIRAVKSQQNVWAAQDLDLLKKCGISTKDVHVEFSSPVVENRKEEKEVAEFLIDRGIASRQTIGQIFDVNYKDEVALIKREAAEAKAIADIITPPLVEEKQADDGAPVTDPETKQAAEPAAAAPENSA